MEKAALWTDGRYYLQAENQLGLEWTLMRGGSVGVPSYSEWLRDNLSDPPRWCGGAQANLVSQRDSTHFCRSQLD
ncbi:xaa-Pro aminopeptidase ApepP [Selaginella moellendorffii]|uniref:xaa-Pro aminopeptidase ApepP n=1 Tax=Selaginella moellendorffii TaxID=88036 RepID=UPI000D1C6256|nr:xaa-Pro aminopeptidase ApepP [Selaginella moellendorffii]|eukprot:XP_024540486.1 xaa-Pro aminopeptidase ApepP [Selaginella moellendorffii]